MKFLGFLSLSLVLLVSGVLAAPWWQVLEQYETVEERNKAFYRSLAKPKKQTPAKTAKLPLETQKYIIVVAPHPDDEILCCTSVIRNAVQQKKPLKIVYLTDGDAHSREDNQASRNYGKTRRQESTIATTRLSVDRKDLIWLGFPDGSLPALDQHIFTSPYTGQNKTSQTTYRPGTTYTRANLEVLLADVFATYPPESVYFPDENRDRHKDHALAGEIINGLLTPEMHHYRYVIHDGGFSKTPGFFDRTKASLIEIFMSQFHDQHHAQFLAQFAYRAEQFE